MREQLVILFTVICFIVGGWNLAIAILGRFPRFCDSAVGTLSKANTKHNYRSRPYRRPIPYLTDYTYLYTVDGRQYKYSGRNFHSKRRLFPKASMIYIKGLPHRAYPNKFTGELEWILGIVMLFMGISLLWVIFQAVPTA